MKDDIMKNEIKGLRCYVYTTPTFKGCSNGGISETATEVLLTGPGIPQVHSADDKTPVVKLVRRNLSGGEYLHVEPIVKPVGAVGPMMGGAYVSSSDSRFPSRQPLPLHDRFETPEQYRQLSA